MKEEFSLCLCFVKRVPTPAAKSAMFYISFVSDVDILQWLLHTLINRSVLKDHTTRSMITE